MSMVVICSVSKGSDIVLFPTQLQATYTDVRQWEELMDFINKNKHLKEPYTLTSRVKCTLENDTFEAEYMGLYPHGQLRQDPT
jgi:hypothetical protein